MTYIDIYNSMIKKADSAPTNYMQYIVKKGDNPWTINRNYGLKQGTIQSLNKGVNFKALKIGTKLKLPVDAKLKKRYKTSEGYDYFKPTGYTMNGAKMQQSSLNPNAIGDKKKAYGILQVQQKAVDDVNRVFKTKYTLKDAFDVKKAQDIFNKYLSLYGKQYYQDTGKYPTSQIHWRMWNGGPKGYLKQSTKEYINDINDKYKQWYKFKWSKDQIPFVKGQIKAQKLRERARQFDDKQRKLQKIKRVALNK